MDTYEKKYKEIVGQLKKAYLYAQTDSTKAVLEEIFPELKESEDEMIRKEIIKLVTFYYASSLALKHTVSKDDMISWLEKQKVTASNENIEKMRNVAIQACQYMVENFENSTKQYEDAINWLEKQGEKETGQREENLEELLAADDIYQMAMNDDMVQEAKTKAINALSELQIGKLLGLEKQGETFTKRDVDDAYLKGICDAKQELEKQSEHKPQRMISAEAKEAMFGKPAWSEEDEQHIDSLLKRLDGLCRNEFERTRFAINEDEDWLKSLKVRI